MERLITTLYLHLLREEAVAACNSSYSLYREASEGKVQLYATLEDICNLILSVISIYECHKIRELRN